VDPALLVPTRTTGWLRRLRQLGGSGSYQHYQAATKIDFGTNDYWFDLWFRVDNLDAEHGLFITGGSATNVAGVLSRVTTTGRVRVDISDGGGTRTIQYTLTGSVQARHVHHLTVTADRDGNCVLYLDGIASGDPEDISAYELTNINGGLNTTLGARASTLLPLIGWIGQLRVGIGSLPDADEIIELHNYGLPPRHDDLSTALKAKITHYWDWTPQSGDLAHYDADTDWRLREINGPHRPIPRKPSRTAVNDGTIITSLASLTPWTVSGTDVTGAVETGTTHSKVGGIKLTGTGTANGELTHTPASPEDWSGRVIYLRFYVPDTARCGTVRLYAFTGASDYFTHNAARQQGWNHRLIDTADFDSTGSPDWESIAYWKLRMSAADTPTECIFDCLSESPGPCIIIPTSDDGQTVNHTYLADWTTRSLKCSAHLVKDWIGTTGKLTTAQVDDLYAAGWDICAHSVTHTDMTTLSAAQAEDELAESQAYLRANGWTRGSRFFAWPHAASNATVRALSAKYYDIARDDAAVPWPHMPPGSPELQYYTSKACDAVDAAAFEALIDDAIARGGVFVTYWHTFNSQAILQDCLDYLVTKQTAGLLTVMTWSEYWAWLRQRYGSFGFYTRQ